jgi:hypothetical protein
MAKTMSTIGLNELRTMVICSRLAGEWLKPEEDKARERASRA